MVRGLSPGWCTAGAQGGSVALELMESGKYRVRGVTRSPDSERAKKLKAGGVEVVLADMGNRDEVMEALQGAYAAYVVCKCSWQQAGRSLEGVPSLLWAL